MEDEKEETVVQLKENEIEELAKIKEELENPSAEPKQTAEEKDDVTEEENLYIEEPTSDPVQQAIENVASIFSGMLSEGSEPANAQELDDTFDHFEHENPFNSFPKTPFDTEFQDSLNGNPFDLFPSSPRDAGFQDTMNVPLEEVSYNMLRDAEEESPESIEIEIIGGPLELPGERETDDENLPVLEIEPWLLK
jgi:hypothetical protein